MKPKILVTRKLSDGAEEKLKKNFEGKAPPPPKKRPFLGGGGPKL